MSEAKAMVEFEPTQDSYGDLEMARTETLEDLGNN